MITIEVTSVSSMGRGVHELGVSFIHEKARIPRRRFYESAIQHYYPNLDDDALIPITLKKEDIIVIVVGGTGKHSSFLPGFLSLSVTKAILY